MEKCSLCSCYTGWDEVVRIGVKDWKGKSLCIVICKLTLGATVYHIWKHRNNVKFGNCLYTEEQILKKICWDVISWILGKGNGIFAQAQ